MDYTSPSNSKKSKELEEGKSTTPEKNLDKVVKGEVIVKKKGLGRRAKDLVLAADLKGAAKYVLISVMIPNIRNLIFEAGDTWWKQIVYRGEPSRRSGLPGSSYRVQYNNPIQRQQYPPDPRYAPPVQQGPRRSQRSSQDDLILSSRQEAEEVLTHLNDIIEKYDCASVFDLHELVGIPSNHAEQKWGWGSLVGTPIHQVREGFLLALPPAEPI